jgi:hypothetical protein
MGCHDEAKAVFSLAPVTAEISLWLAYLEHRPLQTDTLNPQFAFPYRSETAEILEEMLRSRSDWFLKYQLALIYKDRNRAAECLQLLMDCTNQPAYAPFYIFRAGLEGDSLAAFDLKKAISIDPGSWRYQKMLTEFYLAHNRKDLALAQASAFYKDHKQNYILGMLLAKTLLANEKYNQVDKLLSRLEIIPFEGATEGRELYREAKLQEALTAFRRKQFGRTILFMEESKKWPANLGVGKPYDAAIDLRLENWIGYKAAERLKDSLQAQKYLNAIVSNISEHRNSRSQSANALVTALAYEAKGQREKGALWLQNQVNISPDNELLKWALASFNHDSKGAEPDSSKNTNLRILLKLETLSENQTK